MVSFWTVCLIVGATQLYSKREVIAIFLCKNRESSRKIKVLTIVKIKTGCQFDTTAQYEEVKTNEI